MEQKIEALHADKLYAAECKRFFIHINIYMHQQTNTKIEKKEALHISINAYICAYMHLGAAHGVSRAGDQPKSAYSFYLGVSSAGLFDCYI